MLCYGRCLGGVSVAVCRDGASVGMWFDSRMVLAGKESADVIIKLPVPRESIIPGWFSAVVS